MECWTCSNWCVSVVTFVRKARSKVRVCFADKTVFFLVQGRPLCTRFRRVFRSRKWTREIEQKRKRRGLAKIFPNPRSRKGFRWSHPTDERKAVVGDRASKLLPQRGACNAFRKKQTLQISTVRSPAKDYTRFVVENSKNLACSTWNNKKLATSRSKFEKNGL